MSEAFKIYTERDSLIIENPSYPFIRAVVDYQKHFPEIREISVSGKCKISEVKRTLKRMVVFLENHQRTFFLN